MSARRAAAEAVAKPDFKERVGKALAVVFATVLLAPVLYYPVVVKENRRLQALAAESANSKN